MASITVSPLPVPHQDAVIHQMARKQPAPFLYSPHYPEPDPDDPFAPLSVLRSRTASMNPLLDEGTMGASPRFTSYMPATPVGREKSGQHHPFKDLASFVARQRQKSVHNFPREAEFMRAAEDQVPWRGFAFQLRKGISSSGLASLSVRRVADAVDQMQQTEHPHPRSSLSIQRNESRRRFQRADGYKLMQIEVAAELVHG